VILFVEVLIYAF